MTITTGSVPRLCRDAVHPFRRACGHAAPSHRHARHPRTCGKHRLYSILVLVQQYYTAYRAQDPAPNWIDLNPQALLLEIPGGHRNPLLYPSGIAASTRLAFALYNALAPLLTGVSGMGPSRSSQFSAVRFPDRPAASVSFLQSQPACRRGNFSARSLPSICGDAPYPTDETADRIIVDGGRRDDPPGPHFTTLRIPVGYHAGDYIYKHRLYSRSLTGP